jgi:hypothetical protein
MWDSCVIGTRKFPLSSLSYHPPFLLCPKRLGSPKWQQWPNAGTVALCGGSGLLPIKFWKGDLLEILFSLGPLYQCYRKKGHLFSVWWRCS